MLIRFGSAIKKAKESWETIRSVASGLVAPSVTKITRPHELLLKSFRYLCEEIDRLAEIDNFDAVDNSNGTVDPSLYDNLAVIIDILRQESCEWSKRCAESPLAESVYDSACLQCFEAFVENHVMSELCVRAIRDSPRGTMTMVLNAITLMLQGVRYPLLVHQTIHKPIANLISVASRFDALRDGLVSQEQRATFSNKSKGPSSGSTTDKRLGKQEDGDKERNLPDGVYKKEIDMALLGLVSILWLKIRENPLVLDFFTVVDHRNKERPTNRPRMQPQMDVLTCVANFIDRRGSLGSVAKEVLLVAVAMRDPRVDAFILSHTAIFTRIVGRLEECFYFAMEALVAAGKQQGHGHAQGQGALGGHVSGRKSSSDDREDVCQLSPMVSARGGNPVGNIGSGLVPGQSSGSVVTPSSSSSSSSSFSQGMSAAVSGFSKSMAIGVELFSSPLMHRHKNTPCTPVMPDTAAPSSAHPSAAPAAVLQDLIRSMRFCDAFASACSGGAVHADDMLLSGDSVAARIARLRRSGGSIDGDAVSFHGSNECVYDLPSLTMTMRESFLQVYRRQFLEKCLLGALTANGEHHVVAASLLTRLLMADLRRRSPSGPLLQTTTSYLCRAGTEVAPGTRKGTTQSLEITTPTSIRANNVVGDVSSTGTTHEQLNGQAIDVVQLCISRASSPQVPIAMSGSLLLSLLLQTSGLQDAMTIIHRHALAQGEPRHSTVEVALKQDSRRPTADLLCELEDESLVDGSTERQTSPQQSPQHQHQHQHQHHHHQHQGTASPRLRLDQFAEDIVVETYARMSMGRIMARLAGKLSVFSNEAGAMATSNSDETAPSLDIRGGALFELLVRKLGTFFALRFEEQVALSGLLDHFTSLLCAQIATACGSSLTSESLEMCGLVAQLLQLKRCVATLWQDVNEHLRRVPNWTSKTSAYRQYLLDGSYNGSGIDGCNIRNVGTNERSSGCGGVGWERLTASELPQTRRVIEAAVLTQEILREMRAMLRALKYLRTHLLDAITRAREELAEDAEEEGSSQSMQAGMPGVIADLSVLWEDEVDDEPRATSTTTATPSAEGTLFHEVAGIKQVKRAENVIDSGSITNPSDESMMSSGDGRDKEACDTRTNTNDHVFADAAHNSAITSVNRNDGTIPSSGVTVEADEFLAELQSLMRKLEEFRLDSSCSPTPSSEGEAQSVTFQIEAVGS